MYIYAESPPQRRGACRMAAALSIGTMLLLNSCAAYRAKPVDPIALEQAWRLLDPTAASESVRKAMGDSDKLPESFDLSDGISLDEAEVTALFFNPSIRATRMEIGVPESDAAHAKLWEDPELGIDGEYILENVDEPLIFGAGLSITIPLSGRPGVKKKLAQARVNDAEAAALGAEWALINSLRKDWLRLAANEARIKLLENSQETLQTLINLAPKFRAAQAITVVDERLLQIQLKTVLDSLQQVKYQNEELRLNVIAMLGLHPDHPWNFQADINDLASNNREPNLSELIKHPSMRQVLTAYEIAERQLELEVRKQYPDLTLGFGGAVEDDEPRLTFGLGLLPIPLWNRNKAGIASAEINRDVVAMQIQAALQNIIYNDRQSRRQKIALQKRLNFYENEVAPLADQQVADARRLTGLGQVDLFMLADAVELSRDVRLNLLEIQVEHCLAVLELDALTGPPIDSTHIKNNSPVENSDQEKAEATSIKEKQ